MRRSLRNYWIATLCGWIACLGAPQTEAQAAGDPVAIEGTVSGPDGAVHAGTYKSRLHFFSNREGGTPIGPAYESEVSLDSEGTFRIEVPAEALSEGLPDPADTWLSLMIDLDGNGLDERDYVLGSYYQARARLADSPFECKLPPAARPTPDDAPTSTVTSRVNPDYQLPSDVIVNVRDLGAKGDGLSDDTVVIQAAIDMLKTSGGRVYFPPGSYSIGSLNMTNRSRVVLCGPGPLSTTLLARTEGVHMIDMTGSAYCHIEDLSMSSGKVVPLTALYFAQNKQWSGNAAHLENLYVSGHFSLATFYCAGFQSSDILNCDFYNYKPDDSPVVYFSRSNRAQAKSQFAEVSEVPIITSDWTVSACEIHSFAAQHGGPSKAPALVLDGVQQMRWIGGNISGSGPQYVLLRDTATWILFEGTTFYSDNGTPADSIFHVEDHVQGLSVNQCHVQASQAVITGTKGTVFDTLTFSSWIPAQPPYLIACEGGTILNSSLQCGGHGVKAGTIKGSMLIGAGKIEAELVDSMALGKVGE